MADELLGKTLDAALRPAVASLGAWGVVDAQWLLDERGAPVVWLRTRTELERVALQAQPWLDGHVQLIMTRVSVPYEALRRVQLDVTSIEAERRLLG